MYKQLSENKIFWNLMPNLTSIFRQKQAHLRYISGLDVWSPPLLPWVRHRQRVVEGSSVELVRGSGSGVDSTIIVLSLEAKGRLLALLLPRFQQDQQRQVGSSLTLTTSISKVNISIFISLTFTIFFSFAISGFCFIIRLLLLLFLNNEKLVKYLKLLEEYWVF